MGKNILKNEGNYSGRIRVPFKKEIWKEVTWFIMINVDRVQIEKISVLFSDRLSRWYLHLFLANLGFYVEKKADIQIDLKSNDLK